VGTNYIYFLVNDNFIDTRAYDNAFVGKHHPPHGDTQRFWDKLKRRGIDPKLFDGPLNQGMDSIIIIKNPYSWYLSIKRYIEKKGDGTRKLPFDKEFQYYNMLYYKLKEFHDDPGAIAGYFNRATTVRYEDLLADTPGTLRKIADKFGIQMLDSIKTRNKINMSGPFNQARKDFYLGDGSFGLQQNIIDDINNIVDWDLMDFYGYRRI